MLVYIKRGNCALQSVRQCFDLFAVSHIYKHRVSCDFLFNNFDLIFFFKFNVKRSTEKNISLS